MSIEFRNVTFRYPHAKTPALDNVSFRIEAGELCSIVGFSGSGKTSLIALLVRLHDPREPDSYRAVLA
jgi:ABC-type multidrug transport system fused ATPase/permease subunit